ncbi:MAG: hypothetical protein ABL897_16275 [Hyphomicrobium sp.]
MRQACACAVPALGLATGQDSKARETRPMVDFKDANDVIAQLKRENAELSGLALATGVILTQLLQANCKRELNPQAAASRIMANARDAIQGFASTTDVDSVMKARALEAVQQYEEQIKSVLQV